MSELTVPERSAELKRLRAAMILPNAKFTAKSIREGPWITDMAIGNSEYLAYAANHAVEIIEGLEEGIAVLNRAARELTVDFNRILAENATLRQQIAENDARIAELEAKHDNY